MSRRSRTTVTVFLAHDDAAEAEERQQCILAASLDEDALDEWIVEHGGARGWRECSHADAQRLIARFPATLETEE